MIGLDTNILVRIFTRDDARQVTAAETLIRKTGQDGCYVSLVALIELSWTLTRRYRIPKSALIQVLSDLLRRTEIVLQNRAEVETALEDFAEGPADFQDYLILGLNSQSGAMPTYTFDQKAARHAGFELLPI